ncbi:MAG: hypothetical protein HDR72_06745 [Ruminococcaceae bacterium]|nr:hypothetical protein [Oscillospiraceae bacterium]
MTDRDFLELFHKIDDKFLEEAQKDQRKRHFSRQRIFNTLSTLAACMAIVVAAVLLVSSFISSGQYIMPNSGSQTSDSDPLNAASSPTVNIEPNAPAPTLSSESSLSFPIHYAELDLPKENMYNAFRAGRFDTITALFDFSVHLSDDSSDTRIPSRLYIFANGEPIRFKYKDSEAFFRDFTIVPDADYSLPLYFEASEEIAVISVVCVFFPGDPERQSCVVHSAGNIFGATEIPDMVDEQHFIETDYEATANFVTVTSDPHKIPKNGIAYGDELNIPADSAWLTASLGVPCKTEQSDVYEESLDVNPHYIIALVNGKPVSISEYASMICLDGFYNSNKGLLYQYKIPEEYLPENSTLQIIALPVAVTSWRDTDYSSDCFRIV